MKNKAKKNPAESMKPKLFTVMKNYSKGQFVKDLVSGIIVAIIALPLSIALALASGVAPEQGLYTAITAGFVVSFLGGSRVQIAGPTAALSTLFFANDHIFRLSVIGQADFVLFAQIFILSPKNN